MMRASILPRLLFLVVWWLLTLTHAAWPQNIPINRVPSTTGSGAATYNPDMTQFLTQEDADRLGELPLFPEGVLARNGGGVHGTAASMTSPPFGTIAYTNAGNRIGQAATSINYSTQTCPTTGTAWVIASAQTASTVGTYLRVPGTIYYTDCTSGGLVRPTLPDDSTYLMKVTLSGGQITFVDDIAVRKLDLQTTTLDASQYPGATLGEKVHNALLDLPAAGGTVDARRLFQTPLTTNSIIQDMFADLDRRMPITLLFGAGAILQPVRQNPTSFTTIICDPAGGAAMGSTVTESAHGTVFQWTGVTNEVMWFFNDTTHVHLQGCVFNAQSVAGVLPLVFDGTNTPWGTFHHLERLTLVNFASAGITVGGTGGLANVVENTLRFERVHINANTATSIGIIVNSSNTYNTVFDQVIVQSTNIGIYLANSAGFTSIQHLLCNGLLGTTGSCLKVVAVDGLSIRDSAHQGGAATDDFAITWDSTGPNKTCHLIHNFYLGRSIRVGATVCIISQGLYGPGQAYSFGGFAPRIISIGDAFPWNAVAGPIAQAAMTGWVGTTTTQITRIGQVSSANNQFPMTLEADANGSPILLRLVSTAPGGTTGLGLRNSATGGNDWALEVTTLNQGDFRIRNLNASQAGFRIEPLTAPDTLVLSTTGVKILSVTAATLPLAPEGTLLHCSNCTVATPASCGNSTQAACVCVAGGIGAIAKRVAGGWFCN